MVQLKSESQQMNVVEAERLNCNLIGFKNSQLHALINLAHHQVFMNNESNESLNNQDSYNVSSTF